MGKTFKNIWNRNKDADNKAQRSFVRYVIVATALFLLFLLVKKDSVITWINAGITIGNQKKQIESLEKTNSELDKRIEALAGNRDSLEYFAREEYFLSAPGDDVYILDSE